MNIRLSQALTGPEELAAVAAALERNYFGHAERVVDFEAALAGVLDVEPARVVCVGNGTHALHLALTQAAVDGHEVLVPSLTFVASYQAIALAGGTPVSCDIDANTLLMDLDDAARRVTPRTRAIMPVHYGGASCDMARTRALAARHGLRIIEDAAHAFGSTRDGALLGRDADFACFSFDSIKNITCGEGGAVVCGHADDAREVRERRHLSVRPAAAGAEPDVSRMGYRYHMSNLNAAIGLAQLAKLDAFVARRREICRRYDAAFGSLDAVALPPRDWNDVAPHIYVLRVRDGRRDALRAALKAAQIETGINYVPNHLYTLFRGGPLPVTEQVYREIVTLPLHCALSDADVDRIIGGVRAFFATGIPS